MHALKETPFRAGRVLTPSQTNAGVAFGSGGLGGWLLIVFVLGLACASRLAGNCATAIGVGRACQHTLYGLITEDALKAQDGIEGSRRPLRCGARGGAVGRCPTVGALGLWCQGLHFFLRQRSSAGNRRNRAPTQSQRPLPYLRPALAWIVRVSVKKLKDERRPRCGIAAPLSVDPPADAPARSNGRSPGSCLGSRAGLFRAHRRTIAKAG